MIKYIKRLSYINYMIKRKATGDLETFARKNKLSKRTLTDILSEMKELGFPIKYDRMRNTYYYEEEGEMISCLFLKYGQVLPREDMKKIGAAPENFVFQKRPYSRFVKIYKKLRGKNTAMGAFSFVPSY